MTAPAKIALSDAERAMIRRRPSKTGLVGVVNFRGPRGRQYRPIRTAACVGRVGVEREIAEIRGKRYANGAFATSAAIRTVNHLGVVLDVENL